MNVLAKPRMSVDEFLAWAGDAIATRIITDGVIALDPPGLELDLNDIYGGV